MRKATMGITVQGIGVVGGFGTGVEALARALATGESRPGLLAVPMAEGCLELTAFRADTSRLEDFIPRRSLRRVDRYAQLGLLGAHLALADAGLLEENRAGMGLVLASGFGATATTLALIDSIIADSDVCASPTHFANSLHNAAAANISMALGATGPNLTVSQLHASVPSALLTARQWLAEGRVHRLLFGAVDELSDLTGYTWFRRRGLPRGPMRPLETDEETAIPGEGAAFFVLSGADDAPKHYCSLEPVLTGRGFRPEQLAKRGGRLLLNVDGRREYGSGYAALASQPGVLCHTPLYGSSPVSAAFDVAAAALEMGQEGAEPSLERISCISLTEDDGFGLVVLGRA